MDIVFRRFWKPAFTRPVDHARSDLYRSFIALGSGALILALGLPIAATLSPLVLGIVLHGAAMLGPWGIVAAQHLSAVLAPMALAASFMGASTSILRSAVFFDFYARRRNEDGRGNRFTKAFTNLWAKTPLILLTRAKLEEDRSDDKLRRHFAVLDKRVNTASSEDQARAYRQDGKAYARILKTIYPNNDLLPSAAGALTLVSSVNGIATSIAEGLSWLALPLKMLTGIAGTLYGLVHLSMFTAKKSASAVDTPYFDHIDALIRKTPLRNLAAFELRRQIRKIDAMTVTPELSRDLVSLSIDNTLHRLADRSGAPCGGMLRELFNVAAKGDVVRLKDASVCLTETGMHTQPCHKTPCFDKC